ncbi:MAG: hypothetical protein ACLFR2_01645 [Candidatus Kapaibacterium sp.]
MKKLVTLLILLVGVSPVLSEERTEAGKAFKYMMRQAHPLPDSKGNVKIDPVLPLAGSVSTTIFHNANTIGDESIYPQQMQNESSVAVNPLDPTFLIASAVDYRAESSTWIYMSTDGGHSWINKNLGKPFPDWRSTNDPSVTFDMNGYGYLCYGGFGERKDTMDVPLGENGVFVARTTDMGQTWEAHIPVILHQGPQTLDSAFEDKYYIEADNNPQSPYFGHLYIPWKRVIARDSSTQIVISKSTDQGLTWSEPVNVSYKVDGSSVDTTFGQSFPLAATGPDGAVYVVWNHGIEHGVGFSKSTDGGETWSDPEIIHYYDIFGVTNDISGNDVVPVWRHTVKGVVRAEAYPVIKVDNTGGERDATVYVCWAADRIPNIYFSKSTDGGENWTEPVIVHSDTLNDQFWPWMGVDPMNGDLAIMYFDSRNDPENLLVECWVSYSSDGGESWVDRAAGNAENDLRNNPFRANSFAGDYSGLDFYDGIAYPTWVDMRHAGAAGIDSDVYTAIVNVNAPIPPENFTANVLPDKLTELELNWEPVYETSFGKQLSADDIFFRIYREGGLIAETDGIATSYLDSGLEAFEEYNYEIYSYKESVTRLDSSRVTEITGYPGGSKFPDAPEIISKAGDEDLNITLGLSLPEFRTDGQTPLVNMNRINIYRDGELLESRDISAADAGKIITLEDEVPVQGFYTYELTVSDFFEQESIETESERSNRVIVYAGPIMNRVTQNFDGQLPKYYISGNWQVTDGFAFSKPNSYSISPDENYKSKAADTVIFFPVNPNALYMTLKHAAVIHVSDTAFIEISEDLETWHQIAAYNKKGHPAWGDGSLNSDDWLDDKIYFGEAVTDNWESIYLRLRFKSNAIFEDEGWYVDDIDISETPFSVQEDLSESGIQVYPNPVNRFLNIKISDDMILDRISAVLTNPLGVSYDLEGRLLSDGNLVFADLAGLPQGAYILSLRNSGGKVYNANVRIIR